jgi:hypothetical protein
MNSQLDRFRPDLALRSAQEAGDFAERCPAPQPAPHKKKVLFAPRLGYEWPLAFPTLSF